jgi:outer membrane protein insertion porin family/translocation and assembly module TamA
MTVRGPILLTASFVAAFPILLAAQNARKEPEIAPEVRYQDFPGVEHVDLQDLMMSISTQASRCRSLLIYPFCLVSHSPTFWDLHYLDEAEVPRDVFRIRLYYWKRGYRDVEVDTSIVPIDRRRVHVTFTVHENEPTRVRRIAITHDTTLISAKTRHRLTLVHAKDPLDLVLLDSTRGLFENELWNKGYGDAVVDTIVTVDSMNHLADVAVKLTPNRRTTIGHITVTGTQRVDVHTIRNSLTFTTGDLYRQSDILESQRNLYESNLFRLVAIDVPPQYDTVKNVTIDVTEAPLHEARIGPGLDNVDFFQVQSHYTSYNLFGGARRLDIDGTVGNLFASALEGHGVFRNIRAEVPDSIVSPFLAPTYTGSIDFKQPAFLRRPADAAGFGVFTHRNINPGVYIDRGYGGQATFTHQVLIRAPVSVNYRYELNRVQASDVYFCVNYGVCDSLTINTLRAHQSLSPLTLTGFIDRSDVPFAPTKGYVARLDMEYASSSTGSEYHYSRAFFDGAFYTHASGTKRVLASHLRLGWVRALPGGTDVLHPRKRFYAGGANSVRGYNENQLGPRILTIDASSLDTTSGINGGTCGRTVATVKYCDPNSPKLSNSDFLPQPLGGTSLLEGSVEYRVPMPLARYGALRNYVLAVFVDGGIVGSSSIQGYQTISNIVKGTGAVTPGVGVRYESSVGPIRVDVGFNPSRSENLAVATAVPDSAGRIQIVPLSTPRSFSQGRTLLDRLALHFSIGEAY